jgi:hypothetical protein
VQRWGANAPPLFFLPDNSSLGHCRTNKKKKFLNDYFGGVKTNKNEKPVFG